MSLETEYQTEINNFILEIKESLRFLKNSVSRLPRSTWRKHVLWKIDAALRWKQDRKDASLTPFLLLVQFLNNTIQEHRCASLKVSLASVQRIFNELVTMMEVELPS